jgi:two-component system, OmpR family, sensor kinase
MTLRARLVAGLVLLMTVGLGIFGVTMYELYSSSQYRQLDSDLQSSVPLVTQELSQKAGVQLYPSNHSGHYGDGYGLGPGYSTTGSESQPVPGGAVQGGFPSGYGGGAGGSGDGPGGPPVLVAPGTYGELLSSSGKVLYHLYQVTSTSEPRLSASLLADSEASHRVQLGSVSGSAGWLAYIGERLANGDRVVVALPTNEVTSSLNRLVLIEVLGGVGLLMILSVGAGLVLRRGLSPLEQMADTAKEIAEGDLDQRVQVSTQTTEVGELAVAFNTMLDEIQQAFSERDATEDRLRQFLADASHELRTPLTSIQGFAELFRLGADNSRVDTATIIRRIEEESGRMKGLVEDLLLLARLDQVRQAERAPVDLSVLAADACSDAIAAARGRTVTLFAPQPVVVLGDEAHLRQAMANLVTNGLKHTPPTSAIDVSAQLAAGSAVIAVRDHGPGLDDEALTHVFDRFWQKDASRSGKGAGLGLAIVAAVAAEHDGSVKAENAPDGGAIFTMHLPLVPSSSSTTSNSPRDRGKAVSSREAA